MATIKERAKNLDTGRYEDLALEASSSYEFGYMVGATEQKALDINKACEWLNEIENGTTITDIDLFIEDFRKAMEE